MSNPCDQEIPTALALELFQPSPASLYTLDAITQLAGAPRRSILIYCRAGLLRPVFLPPYGVMAFAEEDIYTLRRIEEVRAAHEDGVAWLQSMFALLEEVERLRAEVRFHRTR